MNDDAQLIEQRTSAHGDVALRRRGGHYEIIANGCFLMDTSDGRSERLLVRAALDAVANPQGVRILIGGLGVGFSLAEAAADERPGEIVVVEREQAVIDWHLGHDAPLRPFAGTGHTDPRTRIVHEDLADHLRAAHSAYDVLCLDVDNGPDWRVTEDNADLYGAEGIAAMASALTEHGVLAVWSAARADAFERLLRTHFARVEVLEVPVLGRGEPDVIYLAG
jgi:spermidine synthase